jgi:hypothetical protein
MKSNATKCKEMLICFFQSKPDLPNLCVGDQILEFITQSSWFDYQGWFWVERTYCDDCYQSLHAKELHILCVLYCGGGGIPPRDLITIYYALIRSIWNIALQYGFVVCFGLCLNKYIRKPWENSKTCTADYTARPILQWSAVNVAGP